MKSSQPAENLGNYILALYMMFIHVYYAQKYAGIVS